MTDRNAVNVHEGATRQLAWGYSRAIPEGTRAAWGARLILDQNSRKYGGDLLWDRQDSWWDDDAAKDALHTTINEVQPWRVPLAELIAAGEVRSDRANEVVVFEDERIKVVGNSNGSYGYFYIAGWLK